MKYFYVPAADTDGPLTRMNNTVWPRECELAVCDDGGFRLGVEDHAGDLVTEMAAHYRPWDEQTQPLDHTPTLSDQAASSGDDIREDDLAQARAAVAELPEGPITDEDLARIGVTSEQFSRLADAHMDEEAAQRHATAEQATEPQAATGDSPSGRRFVALEHFDGDYLAEADCADCDGDGLVEVEMGPQHSYTDTCPCVVEGKPDYDDLPDDDFADEADVDEGDVPVTQDGASRLDSALSSAEAACDRIDAAHAEQARDHGRRAESDRDLRADAADEQGWEVQR